MTSKDNAMCIVCKTFRPDYFNIFTSEENPLLDKRLSKVLSVNLTLYRGQRLVICNDCVKALEKIEILELLKAEFIAKFRRKVIDSQAAIASPVPVNRKHSHSASYNPSLQCNNYCKTGQPQIDLNESVESFQSSRIVENDSSSSDNNQACYFLRSTRKCDSAMMEKNCKALSDNLFTNCRSRLKELLLTRNISSVELKNLTENDDDVISLNLSDEAKEMLKKEESSTLSSVQKIVETTKFPENTINLVECIENLGKQSICDYVLNAEKPYGKEACERNAAYRLEEIPLEALNKILALPSNGEKSDSNSINSPVPSETLYDVSKSSKEISFDLNIVMQGVSKDSADASSTSNYHCKPIGELRLKITKDSLQPLCEISDVNTGVIATSNTKNSNNIEMNLNQVGDYTADGVKEIGSRTKCNISKCITDEDDCNSEIENYSEMAWNHISNSKENLPIHIKIQDYLEKCGTSFYPNGCPPAENDNVKNSYSHLKNDSSSLSAELDSINKNTQLNKSNSMDTNVSVLHISEISRNEINEGKNSNVAIEKLNTIRTAHLKNPVISASQNNANYELNSISATESHSSDDPFEFTDMDSFSTDESIPFTPVHYNGRKVRDGGGSIMKGSFRRKSMRGRSMKVISYLKNIPCNPRGVGNRGGYRKRGRKRKYANVSEDRKKQRNDIVETVNECNKVVCTKNQDVLMPYLIPLHTLKTSENIDSNYNESLNNSELVELHKIKQEQSDDCLNEIGNHGKENISEQSKNEQDEDRLLQPHEIKKEIASITDESELAKSTGEENCETDVKSSTLIIEPQNNQLTTLEINEKGATIIYYKGDSSKRISKQSNDLAQDPIGIVLFHVGLCRDRFEGILLCGSCTQPAMFTEFASYEMHLNICHQRCLLYSCSNCGVKSKSAFAAESHLIQTHLIPASNSVYPTNGTNNKDKTSIPDNNKSSNLQISSNAIGSLNKPIKDSKANHFMCGVCNAIFGSHKECFDHMDLHSNSNEFLCDKCALSFPTLDLLKAHDSNHKIASVS